MDDTFLAGTPLFCGMDAAEIQTMLACLGSRTRQYGKGQTILPAGSRATALGLVLTGSADIVLDDPWGNRTLLGRAAAGQLFAETYACLPSEPLLVSVVAHETSEVLFLDVTRALAPCGSACACHSRLIRNLLQITAQKNLALARRSLHTTPKSIRGRLLSYLSQQAQRSGSTHFTIPLDRQQLADHLNVERSALSHELRKMQDDGLLCCRKNEFTLLRGGSALP